MRATVVTTVHPKSLMLVQVRVDGQHENIPEANLPWAERALPDGGTYVPLLVGDKVWVDYPYLGDSRRPRITGFAHDAPGGTANVAAEASGKGTPFSPPEIEGAPPAPALSPTKDYVYKRQGLREVRSSGGGWAMTHLASGSTLGLNDEGQYFTIIQGQQFVFVSGDLQQKVTGNVTEKIDGDYTLEVGGKFRIKASAVEIVKG